MSYLTSADENIWPWLSTFFLVYGSVNSDVTEELKWTTQSNRLKFSLSVTILIQRKTGTYKFIILSMFRFLNPFPFLVFARQPKLLKDPVWPDKQRNPLYFAKSPMGKKVSQVKSAFKWYLFCWVLMAWSFVFFVFKWKHFLTGKRPF